MERGILGRLILVLVVVYISFALDQWNLNPSKWQLCPRRFMSVVYGLLSLIYFLFILRLWNFDTGNDEDVKDKDEDDERDGFF